MGNKAIMMASVVLITAIGVAAYDAASDDKADPKQTFLKVLVAGGLAAAVVVFFTTSTKPKLSSRPYVLDAPAAPVPMVPAAVQMPTM